MKAAKPGTESRHCDAQIIFTQLHSICCRSGHDSVKCEIARSVDSHYSVDVAGGADGLDRESQNPFARRRAWGVPQTAAHCKKTMKKKKYKKTIKMNIIHQWTHCHLHKKSTGQHECSLAELT